MRLCKTFAAGRHNYIRSEAKTKDVKDGKDVKDKKQIVGTLSLPSLMSLVSFTSLSFGLAHQTA